MPLSSVEMSWESTVVLEACGVVLYRWLTKSQEKFGAYVERRGYGSYCYKLNFTDSVDPCLKSVVMLWS